MASANRRTFRPHVGYSTNVHPGEDLAAVRGSLRDFTAAIRRRVFGERPCGLELRIGIGSARELESSRARSAFREFLAEQGLVLFSVNAYPLSDFHARRVKETVYQPSWADAERARWTNRIGRIVDDLAPDGLGVSVSTLGGCFRGHGHDEAVFRKLARNYLATCEAFLEVSDHSGRDLTLAVEPEPETTFETTRDVADFFEEYLLPLAIEHWKGRGSSARIEADLRRVFSVNIDTCHLSVLFEDQVESLRLLERRGLRLGKAHVTNAVALRNPRRSPRAWEDLRAMDEPRYFHQVCASDANGKITWRTLDLDRLPKRLERGKHPEIAEIRSHFHVPLYLRRFRRLATTRDDTERALAEIVRQGSCEHLVFETYTWPILAGRNVGGSEIIDGISREYRWLLAALERLGVRPAEY